MHKNSNIVWFRQDLRLSDHPALFHAAQIGSVIPLYILDETIGSASKWWLHHSLQSLLDAKVPLVLRSGDPAKILPKLLKETGAEKIFYNRCYEPHAVKRDISLKKTLPIESFNGSLLHEPWEILNNEGTFYKVYTHYWNKALKLDKIEKPLPASTVQWMKNVKTEKLSSWKLLPTHPNWAKEFEIIWAVGETAAQKKLQSFLKSSLKSYAKNRDFPAIDATSLLSPHLHFGEISAHQVYHASKNLAFSEKFLAEIGWREFSYYLLFHFPTLPHSPFRPEFSNFPWKKNARFIKAWQKGETGYPIVDAGMRQLWKTGWMHNRVRMIVASFLIKDLMQPWQVGADWFFDTLVDADVANNSASWQWVAGSGADASPFFRIFNPTLQGEKFDPEGEYIKKWIPELKNIPSRWIHKIWQAPAEIRAKAQDYPEPIVDHEQARHEALEAFKKL